MAELGKQDGAVDVEAELLGHRKSAVCRADRQSVALCGCCSSRNCPAIAHDAQTPRVKSANVNCPPPNIPPPE